MSTNRNGTVGAGSPADERSSRLDSRIDSISENVKNFVGQGTERVDKIKHRVIDAKDQAVSRGNAVMERFTDYVRANPIKAVGIAFGAGYIGMRLFRR